MSSLDYYPKPAKPTGIPGLFDAAPLSENPIMAQHQQAAQQHAIGQQSAQQSAARESRDQQDFDRAQQNRQNPPAIPGLAIKGATVNDRGEVTRTYAPTSEDYVGFDALDPEEQAMVEQIANYQAPFPSRGGLKPDKIMRIRGALASTHPEYDAKEYQSRQSALTGFKSGIQARNITSANTVVGHLGSLMDAAEKMNNTGFKPWNIAGNTARSMTGGHPALVDFETKRNAAVTELAALFKGTGAAPTNQEIKEWREAINPNMTPQEMKTAIGAMVELMGSRMAALQEQWDKGVKNPRDLPFLTPDSRKTLDRLGIPHHAIDPVGADLPGAGTQPAPAAPPAAPAQPAAKTGTEIIERNGKRYEVNHDTRSVREL